MCVYSNYVVLLTSQPILDVMICLSVCTSSDIYIIFDGVGQLGPKQKDCEHSSVPKLNIQKTGPFITPATTTIHLSTTSFDLSVWLWGVLFPWIMVMCCSPWRLIMHANECVRAGEEGDEVYEGESKETQVYTLCYITRAKLIITAPLQPSEQILSL